MSRIRLYGDTSGYVEFKAPDVADNNTVTFPNSPVVEMLANQNQVIEAQETNVVPLILQGKVGQTANLFELKNSSETTIASVSASGSASITGNLSVDTNTFFVDSVNDRVGIKTSSPSTPLHISHSGETIRLTDGTRTAYLGVDANNPWIGTSTNHDMRFVTNGASRMRLNNAGHLVPETTNTYDLGTTSLRWRNIYTQDLHLSNGIGDYTIVEGEEDLFLVNNKNGKSYKFMLSEVDSSDVPPKSER